MTIRKFAQNIEVKLWDKLIPAMNRSQFLQGVINFFYQLIHSKPGFIAAVFLLWSTIGFLAGLIVARLFLVLQLQ